MCWKLQLICSGPIVGRWHVYMYLGISSLPSVSFQGTNSSEGQSSLRDLAEEQYKQTTLHEYPYKSHVVWMSHLLGSSGIYGQGTA